MGPMSQRTKLIILGLILAGIIAIILFDPQNPNLLMALGFLAIPLVIAFAANRYSNFEAIFRKIYGWLYLVILVAGIIYMFGAFIGGEINLNTFLLLFIPLTFLILLAFFVFYLGPLFTKFGNPAAAEKLYSFMIAINHQFGYGYLQRAVVRHNQKQMDIALNDYEQALQIAKHKAANPRSTGFSINYSAALIYANKADIFVYKHDPQQAILECNMGLVLQETHPGVNFLLRYRRGYAQLAAGNNDGAILDFNDLHFEGKTAIYERTMAASLNALKSLALAGLSRLDEAKPLWQKAVAIDPNYANPNWLRDTCLWPENLLSLATQLQTA